MTLIPAPIDSKLEAVPIFPFFVASARSRSCTTRASA
jgi:hypothetical protein